MKIRDSVAFVTGANRGLGLGLGRHARYWSCVSLFTLIIIPTFAQSAQQHQASPLMDRDLEIATALSAAPPEVRPHAGVYVLEQNGFVKVRESQNGFNCIIERRANHISPMCYDAEGSSSTLQATLKRGELLAEGVDPSEIEKRIDGDYRTGRLHGPQKTGIVYVLATDEVWHDQSSNNIARHVYPHIMVYAPYLRNSDIAVAPEQVWRPDRVWVQYEGRPDAYLIFEVGSAWTKP
jgi:hypothetical protein